MTQLELTPHEGHEFTQADADELFALIAGGDIPISVGLLNGSLILFGEEQVLRTFAEQMHGAATSAAQQQPPEHPSRP